MSNYSPIVNYAAKDALSSGDPLKRIKGTEISAEFTAIATMSTTKADLASPTFTGTPSAPTAASGTNTTQLATTAFSYLSIANLITGITGVNGWILSAANTPALYSNSVQRATINSTGNWVVNAPSAGVAVAVTGFSTQNVLNLTGGAGGNLIFGSDGTATSVWFSNAASGVSIGTTSAHPLNLISNNSTRVAITSAGNVTANAPSSGTTLTITSAGGNNGLQITGNASLNAILATDGTCSGIWFFQAAAGSIFGHTSNHALQFYTNNASRVTIAAAGNVTIAAPSSGVALTVTGAALTTPKSVAFSATPTFSASDSNYFDFGALTANVTAMTINNPTAGQTISIRLKQDGTGGRTVAVPGGSKVTGPTSGTANQISLLTLTYNGTDSRWEGSFMTWV